MKLCPSFDISCPSGFPFAILVFRTLIEHQVLLTLPVLRFSNVPANALLAAGYVSLWYVLSDWCMNIGEGLYRVKS